MKFIIWARYKGQKREQIDTATNRQEADYLRTEYKLVFGTDFQVWFTD